MKPSAALPKNGRPLLNPTPVWPVGLVAAIPYRVFRDGMGAEVINPSNQHFNVDGSDSGGIGSCPQSIYRLERPAKNLAVLFFRFLHRFSKKNTQSPLCLRVARHASFAAYAGSKSKQWRWGKCQEELPRGARKNPRPRAKLRFGKKLICRHESLNALTSFMKREDMHLEAPMKIGFEPNEKYLVHS
jgi:hypothetical protein